LLLMSGQNGLTITTPYNATLTSGSNLDQIALRDIQQSSGKRWLHNAGESISLFVTGAANSLSETFKILAAKGDVQMQAQSGDMGITADKQIRLYAILQNQTWSAQKNILITCGGAYIKLEGGNIELHCPGTLTFRGNQHGVTGPASQSFAPPHLPQGEIKPTDLEARYLYHDGEPVKDAKFSAVLADGSVQRGSLGAEGFARLPGVASGTATVTLDADPRPFEKFKAPVQPDDEMNEWFKED
jgi:type VI secretion system secreted protein VgrG